MATVGKKYGYRNDARYVKYYYLEFYDPSRRPKRKRVSLTTRDKRVAQQKAVELERRAALGLFDPWTHRHGAARLTVAEAVERFVVSRKEHCSPSTVATYQYVIGSFAAMLAADFPLAAVEPRHIKSFLEREAAIAEPTRISYQARLRVFFSWCIEEELLKVNPVEKQKRSKRSRRKDLPEYFTQGQFELLCTAIRADGVLKGIDNQWLLDIIEVDVNTGLRRGELCNLRWRDVDLEAEFILVANSADFTTKSGRERRVPIKGRALELLTRLSEARHSEDDDEIIFRGASGGRVNDQYLSKRFRHYRRMASLPKEFNFHSLRHTFASWAVQRGMNLYVLKEIMGHSDIKQTQVYASLSPGTLDREMELHFGKKAFSHPVESAQ